MRKRTLVWVNSIGVATAIVCAFFYFSQRCFQSPATTTQIPKNIAGSSQAPPASPPAASPVAGVGSEPRKEIGSDRYIELAKTDGPGALKRARLDLTPAEFEALLPHLLQVWAANEPLSAIRWLIEQQGLGISDAASSALITAAFSKLGATNPVDALTAVSMVPTDDQKTALKWTGYGAAADGRGRDLIEAARDLDSGIRMTAEAFALEKWVQLNPSDAVSVFNTVVPPSDWEPVRAQMGEAWMNIDPVAASSWWLSSAPDEERRSAIEQIVEIWASAAPGAAAKWLNSIEVRSSEEKDAGIRALAYALSAQDPQAALEWAKTIQNDFLREETVASIKGAAPEATFSPSSGIVPLPETSIAAIGRIHVCSLLAGLLR
jgi:hypothetical protein